MSSFLPGTSAAQLRNEAIEQRLTVELSREFRENQHDVFALQDHELAELWVLEEKARGFSDDEIALKFHDLTGVALDLVREHAATATSIATLSKLAADMHRSGSISGRYRHTRLHGFSFIVFQGNPRLRRHLQRHIFVPNSPTLIKLGVGRAAAGAMLRSGVVFTLVLSPAIRSIEAFLSENEAVIESVLANVAADIVKATISGAAGYFAMTALSTTASAAGVVAVVPLAAGIIVGIVIGASLNMIDTHFGITDRIAEALVQRREDWLLATERSRRDFFYYLFSTEGGLRFIQRFSRQSAIRF